MLFYPVGASNTNAIYRDKTLITPEILEDFVWLDGWATCYYLFYPKGYVSLTYRSADGYWIFKKNLDIVLTLSSYNRIPVATLLTGPDLGPRELAKMILKKDFSIIKEGSYILEDQ